MKVAYCSDLHLEFGSIDIKNTENADMLILGGDILTTHHMVMPDTARGQRMRDFLKQVSEEFPIVLMICGNHEHYHTDMERSFNALRKETETYKNFHLLNDEIFEVNDIVFIGSTLWTDMSGHDPMVEIECNKWMLDFSVIRYKNARFMATHSADLHDKSFAYIQHVIRENRDKQCVVITHHAPSRTSSSPVFHNSPINPAFYSNLDNYIQDQVNIPIWIHGHMHNSSDYMIGNTRIICNPRGYIGEEQQAWDFKVKYFELTAFDKTEEIK